MSRSRKRKQHPGRNSGRGKVPVEQVKADPEVQALIHEWPALNRFQRGRRGDALLPRYTELQLARCLSMSGKRFRDFLLFAKVPVGAQDQFDGMGLKKAVALIRARRKALDRARKLYNGRSGAGLRAKLAATLRTWFHENLAIDKWDAFFWELFEVPAAMSEYRRHITAWWQIEVEGDWLKIIESTRPVPPPEPQGQDYAIFAYHRQWLASWYSRCAPITSVARSTLLLVREQLRKEQKEGRFPDGTKIGERFFKDHY